MRMKPGTPVRDHMLALSVNSMWLSDALAVAFVGPSYSKPKGKIGNNKRKKPNKKGPQKKAKKVNIDGKPKGKCFHCGEKDSGATNHICNTLQGFQVTKELNEGEHTLRVGTGAVVSARAVELWNGHIPNLIHIWIWGCPAYVLKRKMDKIESRSKACVFVRYPKGTRGYYFYSPQDKKVFVSTNATFLEDRYIEDRESKSKVLLEESIEKSSTPEIRTEHTQFDFTYIPPLITDFRTTEMVEDSVPIVHSPHRTKMENEAYGEEENSRNQQSNPINQEPAQLRRSERVIRPPSRYLLYGESLEAVSIEQEEDPITYKEAMEDIDADQ
ncbi:uncharacterized protein [Henckelia pumila]|uniref:uncharacterized protein n=1 Tax=Henckelia pumila TaxID=405737 RepID=UPI003C6DC161